MEKIVELLNEESVFTGLRVADKTQALDVLINSLPLSPLRKKLVQQAIYEREGIISTGVGKGVATPHCKVSEITRHYGALAVLDEPIKFESIDEKPVDFLFLLASPTADDRQHLQLMSRISRLLIDDGFRDKLLTLPTSKAVLEAIAKREKTE